MARQTLSNVDLQIKLEDEIKEKTNRLNQLREKRRLEIGKLAEEYDLHLLSDAKLTEIFKSAKQSSQSGA